MRIAILTHASSPFGHEYAKAFADRDHEVAMFSMSSYEGAGDRAPVHVLVPDFKPWETNSRLLQMGQTGRAYATENMIWDVIGPRYKAFLEQHLRA